MKKIPLTKGYFAIVDDSYYNELIQYKWQANENCNTVYAQRSKCGSISMMHREVMGCNSSLEVDHKDGNGLNNQKSNLRMANKSQNGANRKSAKNSTSKYKGVCWAKKSKKWCSQIKKDGVIHRLGFFCDEEGAAIAYDKAALRLHGEFARVNFIKE